MPRPSRAVVPFATTTAALLTALLATAGCDSKTETTAAPTGEAAAGGQPAGQTGAAAKAEPGHLTGRITMADGSPVPVKDAKYYIFISGVSGPGERVSFTAPVSPDGTFRQKLPDGIYHMPYGHITVRFDGKLHSLDLDPVDPQRDRESKAGIVQNFVWRLTGPKPDVNNSPNNHTHWWGLSVQVPFQIYRSDIKAASKPLPEGSKLTFTLKPTSKLIDGTEAKTLTIERPWKPAEITPIDNLNDLPPANYEVTGVATLPDGSTKPMLFQGKGDYPKFNPTAKILLEPDAITRFYFIPQLGWVAD